MPHNYTQTQKKITLTHAPRERKQKFKIFSNFMLIIDDRKQNKRRTEKEREKQTKNGKSKWKLKTESGYNVKQKKIYKKNVKKPGKIKQRLQRKNEREREK